MMLTIILICITLTGMFVCVCKAVTEGDVREAVDQGATRLRDLQQQLGVATQCGCCANCARALLPDASDSLPRRIRSFIPAIAEPTAV